MLRGKKWDKILQSNEFCPTVHRHGSQTPRFIWCSYNKLDFLGLVCMHIALERLQIIEAHHACKAEASGSAKALRNGGPPVRDEAGAAVKSIILSDETERTQARVRVCVCVWKRMKRSGEVRTFTWSQLKSSFLPLSSQLLTKAHTYFTLHPVSSVCAPNLMHTLDDFQL